jgi:hypothetical protein
MTNESDHSIHPDFDVNQFSVPVITKKLGSIINEPGFVQQEKNRKSLELKR